MTLEGTPLPMLPNHTHVDVWKMKHRESGEGIAITISDDNGSIVAGVHLTKDQWAKLKTIDF